MPPLPRCLVSLLLLRSVSFPLSFILDLIGCFSLDLHLKKFPRPWCISASTSFFVVVFVFSFSGVSLSDLSVVLFQFASLFFLLLWLVCFLFYCATERGTRKEKGRWRRYCIVRGRAKSAKNRTTGTRAGHGGTRFASTTACPTCCIHAPDRIAMTTMRRRIKEERRGRQRVDDGHGRLDRLNDTHHQAATVATLSFRRLFARFNSTRLDLAESERKKWKSDATGATCI